MSRDRRVSYASGLRGADLSRVTGRRRSLPTGRGPAGPSEKARKCSEALRMWARSAGLVVL